MRSFPSCWNKTLAQLGFKRKRRKDSKRNNRFQRRSQFENLEVRQLLAADLELTATIRDFNSSHSDFEHPNASYATGIVLDELGDDGKPVYNTNGPGGVGVSSQDSFNEWYNDTALSESMEITLEFQDLGNNSFSFVQSIADGVVATPTQFFPIDGLLKDQNTNGHNFHFTTELHAAFTYRENQGQGINFAKADDDLWLFIDGQLVVDLGGVHPPLEQEVLLDSLGLEDGKTYSFDLFHAERHTTRSNFVFQIDGIDDLRNVTGDLNLIEDNRLVTRSGDHPDISIVPATFRAPASPGVVRVDISDIQFDSSSPGAQPNDSFELALVDSNGQSVMTTIGPHSDAILNVTQGQLSELRAPGVYTEWEDAGHSQLSVYVDLGIIDYQAKGLTAGVSDLTFIFRLANNDQDDATTATVNFNIHGDDPTPASPPNTPTAELWPSAPETANLPAIRDFSRLVDVTDSFDLDYKHSGFNHELGEISFGLDLTNNGLKALSGDLLLAVSNITNQDVGGIVSAVLATSDGTLPQNIAGLPAGTKYFNLTDLLPKDGEQNYQVGQSIADLLLTFSGEDADRFDFDVHILGHVEQSVSLTEGMRLVTADNTDPFAAAPLIVPNSPTAIRVDFADLQFDTTSNGSADDFYDAFELALLDSTTGAPLLVTDTVSPDSDAFLSIVQGQEANPFTAAGVALDGYNSVTGSGGVIIDISSAIEGTSATLVARLINNDADNNSSVTVDFNVINLAPQVATSVASTPNLWSATVEGTSAGNIDESRLSEVTGSLSYQHKITGLNEADTGDTTGDELLTTIDIIYSDTVPIRDHMLLLVTDIRNQDNALGPFAELANFDGELSSDLVLPSGTISAGTRYIDLSGVLTKTGDYFDTQTLSDLLLKFKTTSNDRFDFDLKLVGYRNQAPTFGDTPSGRAEIGDAYMFDSDPSDPEDDATIVTGTASYTNLLGETIAIDNSILQVASNGVVTFTPTQQLFDDIQREGGFKAVDLQLAVSDGQPDSSLFTDNFSIVINTPPDIITHPGDGSSGNPNFSVPEITTPPLGDVTVTYQDSSTSQVVDGLQVSGNDLTTQESVDLSLLLHEAAAAADVFFLFNGNAELGGPSTPTSVQLIYDDLAIEIDSLVQSNGLIDFGFGVGFAEEYASMDPDEVPFILKQPILDVNHPDFERLLEIAIRRETNGYGGVGGGRDIPLIEALYQLATGDGYDGNGDGDKTDTGLAADVVPQSTEDHINPVITDSGESGDPGLSGDVAPFDTFVSNAKPIKYRLVTVDQMPEILSSSNTETVSGTVGNNAQSDFYRFDAFNGDQIQLTNVSIVGEGFLGPSELLQLYDPDDFLIAEFLLEDLEDYLSAELTIQLEKDGTYVFMARDVPGSNALDYSFDVTRTFNAPIAPKSYTPIDGAIINGNLAVAGTSSNPVTVDYTIQITEPTQLIVDTLSGSNRFAVSVTDILNRTIGQDLRFPTEQEVKFLEPGEYTVSVVSDRSDAIGDYTFRLLALNDLNLNELPPADPVLKFPGTAVVSGTVQIDNDTKFFSFEANESDVIDFSTVKTSGSGSPNWTIIDPFGNVAYESSGQVNETGINLDYSGIYTLQAAGYYYSTSTADYDFTLTRTELGKVSNALRPIVPNSSVAETLVDDLIRPNERISYQIEIEDGSRVYFDALDGSRDVGGYLLSPTGFGFKDLPEAEQNSPSDAMDGLRTNVGPLRVSGSGTFQLIADVDDRYNFVASAGGEIGGAGFREGALPIIVVISDGNYIQHRADEVSGDFNTKLIDNRAGDSVLLNTIINGSDAYEVSDLYAAGIQETIYELNDMSGGIGAKVVGVHFQDQGPGGFPDSTFESLATLTGAVDPDNGNVPIFHATNLRNPDNSLDMSEVSRLAGEAVTTTLKHIDYSVELRSTNPDVDLVDDEGLPIGLAEVQSNGLVSFSDVFFKSASTNGVTFDVEFVRVGTDEVIGRIPGRLIGDQYLADIVVEDLDGDDLTFTLTNPVTLSGADVATLTGTGNTRQFVWNPSENVPSGEYEFTVIVNDTYSGQDQETWTLNLDRSSHSDHIPFVDLNGDDELGADFVGEFSIADSVPVNIVDIGSAIELNNATLKDLNNTNLSSMTVVLTNAQYGNDEELTYDSNIATQAGITHSWDGASHTLTFTGDVPLTAYQDLLRSIEYDNTNENSVAGTRDIVVTAWDRDPTGLTPSVNQATARINVVDANQIPSLVNLNAPGLLLDEENAPNAQTLIATFEIIDDVLGTNEIRLLGPDKDKFAVVPISSTLKELRLADGVVLNYEEKDRLSVSIEVADSALGPNPVLLSYEIVVRNVPEPPVILSPSAATVQEGNTSVLTVIATDEGSAEPLYTKGAAGGDEHLFNLDDASGVLTFAAAPDFETDLSDGQNNVYMVEIIATDEEGQTATQTIAVTVQDVDEPPVIVGGDAVAVDAYENTSTVAVISATNPEPDAPMYSIDSSVGDGSIFQINSATGELSFVSAPNYEIPPLDQTSYLVRVVAVDAAGNSDSQDITVNLLNVEEDPVIKSNGGGATATVFVLENQTFITQVQADDPEAGFIEYIIDETYGNYDLFEFVEFSNGELVFSGLLDYETAAQTTFEVRVVAKDIAGRTDEQIITVNLQDFDEKPNFTSASAVTVNEGDSFVLQLQANDPEGATVTFDRSGGADELLFDVVPATNHLIFQTPPDYEGLIQTGSNVLDVQVRAVDETGNETLQNITVTVANVDELPLVTLENIVVPISEDFISASRFKVADIEISDDAVVPYNITLSGSDSLLFEVFADDLYLKANTNLDFDTNQVLNVTVSVDDPNIGTTPDSTTNLNLFLVDVDETPTIETNILTIVEGQSANLEDNLVAVDPEQIASDQLVYSATNVLRGQFEHTDFSGIAITSFNQQLVDEGKIIFVHDGSDFAPSYELSVSDGTNESVADSAIITFFGVPDIQIQTFFPVINEGDTFGLIMDGTDLGDFGIDKWLINWGDGEIEEILDNPSSATHRYTDNPSSGSTYTITATATNNAGDYIAESNSLEVTVNNVAPTEYILETNPSLIEEGESISLSRVLIDPSSTDTFTITLNRDDGSSLITLQEGVDYTVNRDDATGSTISINYLLTYLDDGVYSWQVDITDDDGDTHMWEHTPGSLTVQDVLPVVTATADTLVANEGEEFTINFSAVDPGDDVVAKWIIDWGDGPAETVLNPSGTVTSRSHTYNTAGTRPVTVIAEDEDGNQSLPAVLEFTVDVESTNDFVGNNDRGMSVAVQPDGKIVVAGYSYNSSNNSDFAVIRYNADGTLDDTFGEDDPGGNKTGMVTTDFFGGHDRGHSVALQEVNGQTKIVVAGYTDDSGNGERNFAVARYNADGTLDDTFGDDDPGGNKKGWLSEDFSGAEDVAWSVAIQADNKIVVGGTADEGASGGKNFAVIRFDVDGTLDSNFDTDGKQTHSLTNNGSGIAGTDIAYDMLLQEVGGETKILLAGIVYPGTLSDFGLLRFNANGSLDTSFGSAGTGVEITNVSSPGSFDTAPSVALQSDGKIIVGGYSVGSGSGNDFSLARYSADGHLDTATFGSNGKVVTNLGGNDQSYAVTVQHNDKILLAGRNNSSGSNDFAVVRYEADGQQIDSSFGTNGIFIQDFDGSGDGVEDIAFTADGGIILAGFATGTGEGHNFAIKKLPIVGGVVVKAVPDISISTSDTVVEEGTVITLDLASLDLADYTIDKWLINWGDGEIEEILDNPSSATHRYTDNPSSGSTYTVTATATNNAGDYLAESNSLDVTVHNVVPYFEEDPLISDVIINEGQSLDIFAEVFDPSASDSLTVTLLPGDGRGPITLQAGTDYSLSQSETGTSVTIEYTLTYPDQMQNYPGIEVTDGEQGALVWDDVLVTVQDVLPVVTATADTLVANEGEEFTINFSAVDPGDDVVAKWIIDWGDGPAETVLNPSGTVTSHSHTYNSAGTRPVTVIAEDEDGNQSLPSALEFTVDVESTNDLFGNDDRGRSVVVQPDGKIVVAGDSDSTNGDSDYAVIRYNADGTLDDTFGEDDIATGKQTGMVTTDFFDGEDQGLSVALQDVNGETKIVVAGYTDEGVNGGGWNFAVARYNSDGTLDDTFGDDDPGGNKTGWISEDFYGAADVARSVAIQADNKIVVGGSADQGGSEGDNFAVMRLNVDGSLDSSFDGAIGSNGKVATNLHGYDDTAYDLVLQQSGGETKIVLVGATWTGAYSDYGIVRYNADGQLDTSFGSAGTGVETTNISTVNRWDTATGIAFQEDGKLVVGGFSASPSNDFSLARYSADGVLDSSFGSQGKVITDIGIELHPDVAIQDDGKILLGSRSRASGGAVNYDFAVVRYDTLGTPDSNFHDNGVFIYDFYGDSDSVLDIAFTSDGGIILAGFATNSSTAKDFAIKKLPVIEGVIVNGPPTVSVNSVLSTLPENQSITIDTKVADIIVTDPGGIGNNQLSLTDNDGDDVYFRIEGNELFLKAGSVLDHESNPVLDITIEVDDSTIGSSPDDTASFSFTVSNVPEAPRIVAPADADTATLIRALNTTFVTTVQADDDDGGSPTYEIIGGADQASFQIDQNTGDLVFTETTSVRDYVVEIVARDSAQPTTLFDTQIITVSVVEEPPRLEPGQSRSILENSANGSDVGIPLELTTSSPAGPYVFAIVDGNTGGTFDIDNNGQLTVADNTLLDTELFPSFVLEVSVSTAGLESTQFVEVNVDNAEETALFSSDLYTFEIGEFASAGTTVGVVTATDPEGDPITYSPLTGSDFEIDQVTGVISISDSAQLSPTGGTPIQLTVTATGGDTANVEITVTDVTNGTPTTYTPPTPTDYTVSHGKQLTFNPLAGLVSSQGAEYEFTNFSLDKNLGVLTANSNGTFTYNPDDDLLSTNRLTTPETNGTGDIFRYSEIETVTYDIVNVGDSSDIPVEQGTFTIKVTNDLPVFIGNLHFVGGTIQDYTNDPGNFPDVNLNNTASTGSALRIFNYEAAILDMEEFFYDADNDDLSINGLVNNNAGGGIITSGAFNQFLPNVGLTFTARTLAPNILSLSHNGTDDKSLDFQNVGLKVFVTDGQTDVGSGTEVASLGSLSASSFDGPLRMSDPRNSGVNSLIDYVTFVDDNHGAFTHTDIANEWELSAASRQSIGIDRQLESVGNALVDLNEGALILRQELNLDGSGGAAEHVLPGLIYDSSTVDPRPVIQGRLDRLSGTDTLTGITARLTWFDHVTTSDEIFGKHHITEQHFDVATFGNDNAFHFSLQPATTPIYTGVYRWQLDLELEFASHPDDTVTIRERGESAVIVQQDVTTTYDATGFPTSPTDFFDYYNGYAPVYWDFTPPFGEGWALENVPQLFVDDVFQFDLFHDNAALQKHDLADDRFILKFPGQTPIVFQLGDNFVTNTKAQRFDYRKNGSFSGSDDFVPLQSTSVSTQLGDPSEFGTLSADLTNGSFSYTDIDGTKYVFSKFENSASYLYADVEAAPAPSWQLTSIQPAGVSNVDAVAFTYFRTTDDPGSPLYPILKDIKNTDGSIVTFTYKPDFSNHVDWFSVDEGSGDIRLIDLDIETGGNPARIEGQLYEIRQLNPSDSVPSEITDPNVQPADLIRRFDYEKFGTQITDFPANTFIEGANDHDADLDLDADITDDNPYGFNFNNNGSKEIEASDFAEQLAVRLVSDQSINIKPDSSEEVSRTSGFAYDDFGILTNVHIGGNSSGAGVTSYQINSLAGQPGLQKMAPIGRADIGATGLSDFLFWRAITSRRNLPLVTERSSVASITVASDIRNLSEADDIDPPENTFITEYQFDQRGNIERREEFFDPTSGTKTSLSKEEWVYDRLGSVKSYTDPLGRHTYYEYDYEIAPYYDTDEDPDNDTDDPANNGGVPLYDLDDYRGNVTKIISTAGVELFEYETDDETDDALGRLVKSTDVRGVVTNYERNNDGQLTSLRTIRGAQDAAGMRDDDFFEEWGYYGAGTGKEGLLETYVSALGLVVAYSYDSNRRLQDTTVTDKGIDESDPADDENAFTNYTYDTYGFLNLVTVYDGTSAVSDNEISQTDYDYDATGLLRRVQVLDPDDNVLSVEQYDYDPDGAVTLVIDGNGVQTQFVYDTRGLLTSQVEAVGETHDALYDGVGSDISIEQTTSYAYYSDGSLQSTTLLDTTTEYYYDPIARPSGSDKGGSTWTKTNGVATLATVSSADGSVSSSVVDEVFRTDYDVLGRTTTEENLLTGAKTTFEYGDIRNNLPTKITEKVNLGATKKTGSPGAEVAPSFTIDDVETILAYDQIGNAVFEKSEGQAAVSRAFDELGYLAKSSVQTSQGVEYEFETDPLGNVKTAIEFRSTPGDSIQHIRTLSEYDQQGRVRKVDYYGDDGDADKTTGTLLASETISHDFNTTTKLLETTSTSIEGLVTKQSIDGVGRLAREVNAFGGTTTFKYDTVGNVIETEFLRAGNDTIPNRKTTYQYDGLNRLRVTTYNGSNPYSNSVDYLQPGDDGEWDVVTTDAEGNSTKTQFDTLGNTVAIAQTDPGQNATGTDALNDAPITVFSYHYDKDNLNQSVTNRLTSLRAEMSPTSHDETRVSRQLYSTDGRLILSADRTILSDSGGPLTDAVVDDGPSGLDTFLDYLDDGFVQRQLNYYNPDRQVGASWDGQDKYTFYTYDANDSGSNLLSSLARENGEQTNYSYDSAGNLITITQVLKDSPDNVTTRSYDALGRILGETITVDRQDGSSGVDVLPAVWTYSGLITTYTDRVGRVITTELHKADGDPSRIDERTVSYTHTGISYNAQVLFHSDGSLKEISDSYDGVQNSKIGYTYNDYGRRITTTQDAQVGILPAPQFVQTTTYHPNGTRNTDTWSRAGIDLLTNTYEFDNLQRLHGIKQDVSASAGSILTERDKSISINYNADGSRADLYRYSDDSYGTAVARTEFTYNADGQRRLEIVTDELGSHAIARHENTYRTDGRLSSVSKDLYHGPTLVLDQKQIFDYDEAGRLKQQNYADENNNDAKVPVQSPTYRYNLAGQLSARVVETVGLANRLTTDSTYEYKYDNNGNVEQKTPIEGGADDRTEYEWDHRNLLIRSAKYDSNVLQEEIEYKYDALGRRIAKTVTSHDNQTPLITKQVGYIYDGNSIVFEYDVVDDSIDRNYLYGPGVNEVLAVDQINTASSTHETVWMFADRLGTVATTGYVDNGILRILHRNFDADGNQVPFLGKFIPGVDDNVTIAQLGDTSSLHGDFLNSAPVIYAGHQWDESLQLYNMKARLYDPITARFFSPDLLGIAGGDTNLYRYVAGDPVNNIDPTGLYAETVIIDVGSFLVGLGSLFYNVSQGNVSDAILDSVGLAADAVAIALPFVPGGAGYAIRAYRGAGFAIDTVQAANRIESSVRIANQVNNVVRTVDLGASAYQTYDAYQRGDTLGVVFGGLGTSIRGVQGGIATRRLLQARTAGVGRIAPVSNRVVFQSTESFNAVTGRATPIPLHDTTAPWYRYVTPRYEGRISVVTTGRTPQQIARTYSHELQHVSDFVNHPQITNLAARKNYFPGTGLARYALETRGYYAGGSLTSPLTPLQSFSSAQKAYLGYDALIFGVGGSAATYNIYDTYFDGE